MYKYLPLTENVQEMMVMLKSLPTCTIVFDSKSQVVDINKAALDFLKINSVDDFRIKRWGILNDCDNLKEIIQRLKTGKTIHNKSVTLRYPDYASASVSFSACMLNGARNIFIFQFFEISPYPYLDYKSFIPQAYKNLNIIDKKPKNNDTQNLFIDNTFKKDTFQRYLDENKIQLLSNKYPNLLNNEIIICGLIGLNIHTAQITCIMCKSESWVRLLLTQIFKKLNIKSRKELYYRIIEDCTIKLKEDLIY